MQEQPEFHKNFKIFIEFTSEEKVYSIDDVMTASMLLLEHVPTTRQVVLKFYSQLFQEYCYEYCLVNTANTANKDRAKIFLPLFGRFVQALNKVKLYQRQDSLNKTDTADKADPDCPQSPSRESNQDYDLEDFTLDLKENGRVTSSFEKYLTKLSDKLNSLISDDEDDDFFKTSISDWALNLASDISQKLSKFVTFYSVNFEDAQNDNRALISSLRFWIQCPVMKFLTVFIFRFFDKSKANQIILNFPPDSYWILAYLFTNPTKGLYLTEFIEELINSSNDETKLNNNSRVVILSYVSKHNPHAIINCSKSNIPFLLKLCTNSKPLLDLLAYDIAKKVDVKVLNKATGAYQSDNIDDALLFCLLNAPNAFELLLISFDLIEQPNSNQTLRKRIFKLHRLIVEKIHNIVFNQTETISDEAYLTILKDNVKNLITHLSIRQNSHSKRIQFRLIYLICIYFGAEFITEVFHHLLNSPMAAVDIGNYENPRLNYLLSPLFTSLRLYFGYKIQISLRDTLKLFFNKTTNFWASLYAWVDTKPDMHKPIDFQDLIDYLNQKFYIARNDTIIIKFYILKILIRLFKEYPKHHQKEQFKLCAALLDLYFDLIEKMQRVDRIYLPLYISTLINCQTFVVNLAKGSSINEQIIVKNLLDLIQARSVLFMENHTNTKFNSINYCTSLLNENSMKSDKIKKSKLLPFYKEQNSSVTVENKSAIFNRQLIIDLFLECIHDSISFAKTFISSLSNEVILNETILLDEDFKDGQIQHVRVTLEQDLLISRLFEKNPILWSLLNVFSKETSLKHCLVLVKALVNVQRAALTSTNNTKTTKNIESTRRLIKLISNDEILPKKPFLYINELLPKCGEWEVAYLLHDIFKYIRDSNEVMTNNLSLKQYLERMRIIFAFKHPGETYAKIFKSI